MEDSILTHQRQREQLKKEKQQIHFNKHTERFLFTLLVFRALLCVLCRRLRRRTFPTRDFFVIHICVHMMSDESTTTKKNEWMKDRKKEHKPLESIDLK